MNQTWYVSGRGVFQSLFTPELAHDVARFAADGIVAVWDTTTLERVADLPLAGLPYRRLNVSGDGLTAVGVTFDNELEVLQATTGAPTGRFGSLNPDGIAEPITLSYDGTIAVTLDLDGTVSLWWVGDDRPIAVVKADAGPARGGTEHHGSHRRLSRTHSASQ